MCHLAGMPARVEFDHTIDDVASPASLKRLELTDRFKAVDWLSYSYLEPTITIGGSKG